MDKERVITFLFEIAKEIKSSFESPVILITSKDYADAIYRLLIEMNTALQHTASNEDIIDIINNLHLDWLRAVREIDEFRKRIKDMPRDNILNAIDFSIKCVNDRYTNFKDYQHTLKTKMSVEDRLIMQADLDIMKDMKETVVSALQVKRSGFKYCADQTDHFVKVDFEIEELLNWLDRLNDNSIMQFYRFINVEDPQLLSDLSKALKEIIDEVSIFSDQSASKFIEKHSSNGKLLSSMVRINASHECEVHKVVEKIKELQDRMERFKEDNSSSVLALQHKVIYLRERLQSLEKLRHSLEALKQEQSKEINEGDITENTELHIFNHYLPHVDRVRLVERLLKRWDSALRGPDGTGKSIISILSATDLKEVFTDDIGQFTVDEYGRKLYSIEDCDVPHQLNERNELVPLTDDDEHIYFYDDCGRYYLSEADRTRIYKAHKYASEYELDPTSGHLLKLNEFVDGVEYKFDDNGRYYIDEDGHRIYCDLETGEKYELDGFGNLVRINETEFSFEPCPDEPMVVQECKYLQKVVGDALKKCLANVLLHQPADPIGFLADNLVKYWQNVEERQKRLIERKELLAEREYHESVPLQSYVPEEEETSKSSFDYDWRNYNTVTTED